MSGIVGLFNLDGRPVEPSELKGLAAALAHRAVDGEDFWIGSAAGIGHQHARATLESSTERQPLISPSGLVVAFDGRLDNRHDILNACSPSVRSPEAAWSDAALVLAAYGACGEAFAARLNGDFALALFDSTNRRLLLARDRMGARALYYCPRPGTVLFASEIKSLLAHRAVRSGPDEDALADLVLDGYSDGTRTCFQGVYSVPPGHVLIVTTDGRVLRPHWDFDPAREIRYRSFDDYAECFRTLFAESVRRRLRSDRPVAVSVSGGLDSSSIFCQASALIKSGATPTDLRGFAMTFPGNPAADEVAYLDHVETASGLPIVRQSVSALRLLADVERTIWHMEMPGLTWDVQSTLLSSARQSGCTVVLDGFFGDQILSDQAYLVDLFRRGRWLTVRRHLRESDAWMTDIEPGLSKRQFRSTLVRALPPRWLFRFVKGRTARGRLGRRLPTWYTAKFLERGIERSLSRPNLDRGFASSHAEHFYKNATSGFCQVQIHRSNATGLMHGLDVAYPFRDRDLVAFLMAIPGEMANRDGVPKALLRHAMRGILPEAIRQRRSKADFTSAGNHAIVSEYPAILRVLTRDSLAVQAGLVDGDRLAHELTTFERRVAGADTALPAWQIGDLVGLELWLRRFFGAASS